ncbi:hypothetical protein JG688_00010228 [Phytophthora aleatoria]|uniref:Histone H4 n=1 Tax=Phytophthora aleatoria TaxID=2496075 RepID=A0A8J5MFN6_9STRA|nr:hypothetical protein JG688_00010228 [Phytophthora aleatoria]
MVRGKGWRHRGEPSQGLARQRSRDHQSGYTSPSTSSRSHPNVKFGLLRDAHCAQSVLNNLIRDTVIYTKHARRKR